MVATILYIIHSSSLRHLVSLYTVIVPCSGNFCMVQCFIYFGWSFMIQIKLCKFFHVKNLWGRLMCLTARTRVKDGIHVSRFGMPFWMIEAVLTFASKSNPRNMVYDCVVMAIAKGLVPLPSLHYYGSFALTSSPYTSFSRFASAENDIINWNIKILPKAAQGFVQDLYLQNFPPYSNEQ